MLGKGVHHYEGEGVHNHLQEEALVARQLGGDGAPVDPLRVARRAAELAHDARVVLARAAADHPVRLHALRVVAA